MSPTELRTTAHRSSYALYLERREDLVGRAERNVAAWRRQVQGMRASLFEELPEGTVLESGSEHCYLLTLTGWVADGTMPEVPTEYVRHLFIAGVIARRTEGATA